MTLFESGKEITSATGKKLVLSARRPPPPTEIVALYPMPHGVTTETLNEITSNWGKLKSYDYGCRKLLPQVRNSYLHLKISELIKEQIPDRIIVNHHYVAVAKPGESMAQRWLLQAQEP